MSDLIDRQAAIDALWAERMKHDEEMERNLETCSFALRADNKARRNRIEEDIEIIKQLPSAQLEQRWIPCSERLPRQGQEVICQCRANMIRVLKLDAYGDWYQDAEHCYMSGFVIAWMPLPEPYEERRTDE